MIRLWALLVVACGLMAACEYFPESEFMLSKESRMPRWFEIPVGVARSDLSVRMSYYLKLSNRVGGVKFEIRNDKTGSRLASFKGEVLNPAPMYVHRIDPTAPPGKRASYSIVRLNGVIEVIEHRRVEPVFDISDDPEVRADLFEQLRENGITVE
jgi:hypothetical protein